jgi:hypothetical protein
VRSPTRNRHFHSTGVLRASDLAHPVARTTPLAVLKE